MRSANIYQDKHQDEAIFVTSVAHFSILFLQKKCLTESSRFGSAQDVSPYDITFTFTGKEKDAETGYSYFGARFYDSDLSGLFLSIDPMADKYSSLSPYAYCAWNPMKLLDPDGRESMSNDDIVIKGTNSPRVTVKTDLVDITINVDYDFGGNYTLQGEQIVSAALDLAGIADPLGVCDGANTVLQAKNGEWGGAVLSALGIIPYVGDIAKLGKVGKDLKILKKAIDGLKKSPQSLGNPFKDKTLKEVEDIFQNYVEKGKLTPAIESAPGNKAYVNKQSGYSYNLDSGNAKEGPHVDVNYPHGNKKLHKKKLPTNGGF